MKNFFNGRCKMKYNVYKNQECLIRNVDKHCAINFLEDKRKKLGKFAQAWGNGLMMNVAFEDVIYSVRGEV
jgi:hypothetical protein